MKYITSKDIILCLIGAVAGFIIAVTLNQYIIPSFVKNIVHRNEILNVNLQIFPKAKIDNDLVRYYFRMENQDSDISLEDIDVRINFPSVIDKEDIHQDMGVLGIEIQKGESIKNSNNANIKIEKFFPRGVLVIIYSVRKEQFGKPPFKVYDIENNFCNIEYSYSYFGTTIRRKLKIPVSKFIMTANYPYGEVKNMNCSSICEGSCKMLTFLGNHISAWVLLLVGWFLAIIIGNRIIKRVEDIQKKLTKDLENSKFDSLRKKWDAVINIGNELTKPNKFLGELEITLFYICFLLNKPEGIGAWLVFKVAVKWESWGNIVKVPRKIWSEGEKIDDFLFLELRNKLATAVSQKFLIGTLGNIVAAAIGFGVFCIIRYLVK